MKKVFLVSNDIKIFIVLRSLLTGALISLLIFFIYFFFSPTLLVPVLILLGSLNLWIAHLTAKKLKHLNEMSAIVLEDGIEWCESNSSQIIPWKEIQKIEISNTPLGTPNTFLVITKNRSFPMHLFEDFDHLWSQIRGRVERSASVYSRIKIWGKEMQLLSATVFCFLLLVLIGTWAMGATDFSFAYFIALIVGLFFILYRPFSQLINEAIAQIEVGLGTLCTLAFIFNFTSGVVLPYLQKEGQSLTSACGLDSPQIRCYSTPQKSCLNVWKQMEVSCRDDLKSYLQSRSPSSLVGPVIARCQKQKFDKSLFYNRTHADTSFCQNYFTSIAKKPTDY